MHTHMCINGGQGGSSPLSPRSPTLDPHGDVKMGKKFEIVTKKCNKIPNLGGGCDFENLAPTSSP